MLYDIYDVNLSSSASRLKIGTPAFLKCRIRRIDGLIPFGLMKTTRALVCARSSVKLITPERPGAGTEKSRPGPPQHSPLESKFSAIVVHIFNLDSSAVIIYFCVNQTSRY
ncbi:hypothetical protein Zmor_027806 [Zophobas morio]|uniref:Uncharacterized protein n=1 Tax=Zophobas morio TaxID=2755281 RepID=A0AA38HU73_9CUCU|nr:hypothetical protein Zmor_027806 [Zophobas morio]